MVFPHLRTEFSITLSAISRRGKKLWQTSIQSLPYKYEDWPDVIKVPEDNCVFSFPIKPSFNLLSLPVRYHLLLLHRLRRSFLRKPIRAIEFYFYCFKKNSHACAAPGEKGVLKPKPCCGSWLIVKILNLNSSIPSQVFSFFKQFVSKEAILPRTPPGCYIGRQNRVWTCRVKKQSPGQSVSQSIKKALEPEWPLSLLLPSY